MIMSLQFLAQETIGRGGVSRVGTGSQLLKGKPLLLGSTLNSFTYLPLKTWAVRTLEHYGKSKKREIVVLSPFLDCGLWCSAQLNCTRFAPPCSKIGFEREEIAGMDQELENSESITKHGKRSSPFLGLGLATCTSVSNSTGVWGHHIIFFWQEDLV